MQELTRRVEQHSIDEMFLTIRGIDTCMSYKSLVCSFAGTGLTIGVGMGPSKTLALYSVEYI